MIELEFFQYLVLSQIFKPFIDNQQQQQQTLNQKSNNDSNSEQQTTKPSSHNQKLRYRGGIETRSK
jgi:hypothetical protein